MPDIINLARYRATIAAQRAQHARPIPPRYYESPHERELYDTLDAYRQVYGFNHGRLDAPSPATV